MYGVAVCVSPVKSVSGFHILLSLAPQSTAVVRFYVYIARGVPVLLMRLECATPEITFFFFALLPSLSLSRLDDTGLTRL